MVSRAQSDARQLGSRFQVVWAATGVSNLADGMLLVVFPLLASTLTRDPAVIAAIAAAQRLPWLLFSLFSGVIVDRADRRALQRATNLFRGLTLSMLGLAVLLGWASIPLLFAAALLLGIAETLFDNAAFALLPALVERDQLERANGRIYTTQTIANEFAGPPLGGALFALAMPAALLANAALYAGAGALISLLRGSFRPVAPVAAAPVSLWGEVAEGLRWFWGHRLLHTLGIKAAVEHGCWTATNAVLVLVAQDRLGLDAAGFGLLLAAGSAGGVVAGLSASRMIARIGPGTASVLNLLIQAVGYLGIALSANTLVVGLMLALLSYTGVVGGVVGISFRQAVIPDQLLGRVSGAFRIYAVGSMALGALLGGLLARSLGLLTPFWISGAALLLLASPCSRSSTIEAWRRLARPRGTRAEG